MPNQFKQLQHLLQQSRLCRRGRDLSLIFSSGRAEEDALLRMVGSIGEIGDAARASFAPAASIAGISWGTVLLAAAAIASAVPA